MIIYLEGIDKAGKSYIANKLNKVLGAMIIKNPHPPINSDDSEINRVMAYYDITINILENPNNYSKIYVLDRFFLSELVYSKVKRDYEAINRYREFYNDIEFRLQRLPHLLVYCYTDINLIKERFKKDNEEYVSEPDINLILTRYTRFIERSRLHKISIDTMTTNNILSLIISEFLKQNPEVLE